MNEQKRQAFLKVMDIQPYFPRQVLVGAKPSPAYDFPDSEVALSVSSTEPVADLSGSGARGKTSIQSLDAIEELRANSNPARKASVTPIRQEPQPQASAENTEPSPEEPAQSSLNFNLRYYRITDSLAVLDEIPIQGSGQISAATHKLMLAIIKALGLEAGTASIRAEEFSWPLQAGYSTKHSPQAEAAKALSGFLRMRQETDGFTNLLVFAGQLEDVLLETEQKKAARDFDSDRGYSVTVTHSLASMLAISALKRDVWLHLQPLRKRLSSSN